MICCQPIFINPIHAQQPHGQQLFWNEMLDTKEIFGPQNVIAIDSGEVEHIFDCEGIPTRQGPRLENTVADFIYIASDIYIKPDSIPITSPSPPPRGPSGPIQLIDVNDAYNTVVTFGGKFNHFALGSTINIGNGKYDVIYDECQDGILNREDANFDQAITVQKPVNYTLSPEARQAFISSKIVQGATANTLEEIIEYVDYLFLLYKFGKWSHALKNSEEKGATATEVILDVVVDKVNSISKDSGVFVDFEIPTGVDDVIKTTIITILKKLALHYRQLAADPPNFNYEKNISLENITLNLNPVVNDKLNNLMYSFTKEVNNEEKIVKAFLSSLESFQGAQIDGNSDWGMIHAQSLKNYSDLLKHQLSNSNITISTIIDILENDYPQLDSDISSLENLRKRIKDSGFTLEETTFLKNSNFTAVQINNIREAFSSINFSFTLEQLIDIFKDISNNHNNLQGFLNVITNEIDKTITEIRENPVNKFLNPPPVAVINSSKSGIIGQSIIFNGSESFSENSTIKQLKWDLDGDGFFDDSNNNITSFTYLDPFDGYVGLKVTNTDDVSSIDYAPLRITSQNNSPILESFTPTEEFINVTAGSFQEFTVTASDENEDNLNIKWFVDGLLVENGESFTYEPFTEDIGAHVISVNVTDNGINPKSVIEDWIVFIIGRDNDLDTWSFNIDCNDNNPSINPGIKEIYNNNIDEDCNPSTPDFNASPIVINNNNIFFLVEPNNSTDLPLLASDLNGDPLTFNILRAPMHGSIGDIIPFNSTLSFVHYVADAGFIGNDSLIFNVNDGKVNSTNVGNIKIRVGSDNSPPLSFSQQLFMRGNGIIVFDRNLPIHLESFDQENDPLTLEILDGPQKGTLSGTFPNLVYTPNMFVNSDHDSFTFRVNDGEFKGNIAKILITFTEIIPNPQNILLHPVADLPRPVSIAHHPLFNKLVVSVNEPTGLPNNLEIVNEDGSHNKYTSISGFTDELKLASVRDTLGGFEVGEIFTGNGKPGEIVRISPDGSSVQDPWIVLPGETGIFRGGLHVDRTGIFNGDLIAVTTVGNVWRINSNGEPTFLAKAQTSTGGPVHLEGVTTVPNIPEKYGPWAGKIVAGAEDLGRFFYIDIEGNISFNAIVQNGIGIAPEDIDIVPPNENFYGADVGSNQLLGAPASTFKEMVGDFLVTQEIGGAPLYHVKWNPITNQFVYKVIYLGSASWEHVTFSPANINDIEAHSNIVADAGPDQTVNENQTNVILNGIASNDPDIDGIITSYQWEQIQGPQVELKNKNKSASSFTAPTVTVDTTLRFKLTVTNNEGVTSYDVVDILVKNTKLIIADAGPDQTVNERSLVTLNGSSNNPDGGNTISYKWSPIGGNNTILLSNPNIANPSFIAPTVNEEGDIITLVLETVNDQGFSDIDDINIIVKDFNSVPIANPQNITIVENTPLNITLTGTDLDTTDELIFIRGAGPSNGILNNFNTTTGQVQYIPLHNFDGTDTFSFKVFDGKQASEPANVTISITEDGINDPPVVQSERVSANVSQQIAIDVLQNDIDPNGDLLTLTNFTGPFNGTAILNQNQTITYQSDPEFNASDVLYYRVSDQFGSFDIGQLIIDVQSDTENQTIQVPSEKLVTTTRNQPINIELIATATIERPAAFFIIDAPDNGTLGDITILSNLSASVNYTPNNGFVGGDSFTYIAIDENGVVSNIGTVLVSIDDIPRNPPVARDGLVMLDEDTSIPIQLNASDSDVNDDLTYSIESQPVSGKILSFDSSTGSLVYEPKNNFNGNDGFLFKAVDQDGLESNIATVFITVNPVNDPPVANNQQLETDQNNPLQIALSGADPFDNDTFSQFRIVNSPTNGQISNFNQTTGELTYTPNSNFFGSDRFTFKVIDSQGLESTESATISINVKEVTPPPVNNPPVAIDKTVETNNNTSVRITLEGTDIDRDTINSFTIVSSPTNGQISNFNSNTGTLTYTPNTNFVGQDSFTFKVTDSRGLQSTNLGLVSINVKLLQPPNNEQPPLPLPSSVCTGSDNSNNKPKGTQGNDDLVGTSQRDTITGLGGNDRFNGCSGDDRLNGNSGNDGMAGGPDDDKLHGNEGNDYLQGDSGSDSLYGNEGNDILVGNEGRDIFFCGSGDDTILDFDYPLDVKSNDCE